jgi:hypothetical protein
VNNEFGVCGEQTRRAAGSGDGFNPAAAVPTGLRPLYLLLRIRRGHRSGIDDAEFKLFDVDLKSVAEFGNARFGQQSRLGVSSHYPARYRGRWHDGKASQWRLYRYQMNDGAQRLCSEWQACNFSHRSAGSRPCGLLTASVAQVTVGRSQ